MADIRCPMCGKFASDELDECPACQARLKPLYISSDDGDHSIHPGDVPVKKESSEVEMPGSSSSTPSKEDPIRPGDAPTKKITSELEFALPSWLRKLRGNTGDKTTISEPREAPQQPEEQDQSLQESLELPVEETLQDPILTGDHEIPEDGLPVEPAETEVKDWLSGLQQTSLEEDETPAWLSNLKDIPQQDQPSAASVEETTENVEGRSWLENLRGIDSPGQDIEPGQDQLVEPVGEPVYDEGIPDWMKKLQSEVDSRVSDSGQKDINQDEGGLDDSPDWLNRLQAETQSNAISNESASPGQENETPDWLEKMSAEIPATQEEAAPIDSDTPDWLRNLQQETKDYENARSAESEPQAVVEENQPLNFGTPEWQNELQPAPSNYVEEEKTGSELPEWLSGVGAEVPQAIEEAVLPSSDETPEWLKDIQPGSSVFEQEDDLTKIGSLDEAETPEWLKEIGTEAPAGSDQESALPVAETPDWLKAMSSELQDPLEPASPDGESGLPEIHSTPVFSSTDGFDEMLPGGTQPPLSAELAAEMRPDQPEAVQELRSELEDQPTDTESMPDWLKNLDKTDTISNGTPALILDEQINASDSEPLLSTEIPSWLRNLDKEDAASLPQEETSQIEPVTNGISPAELPSWVQAMQPVESLISEVGISDKGLEQVTEKAGPLAGLQGVLPSSPGLGKLRKPLNYSIKLRVTDDQTVQASQLEQMLGLESQAKTITAEDKKLPQRILRWVVAVFVLLAVALPVFSGIQNTSSASNYPPELVAAREILFNLPQSSPVLLVFDYEPAYSGELEVTAAPMVDNLLFSGARLAILSTSPTGPTMAEHFLKTTQSQHNYQSGLQYANLGYLAGGASGVLAFATDPTQTIPRAINGSLPWQTPLLQDIHTLADFKAVIILTDNSDTARIWIEQTGSLLGETPLLMAISAQAEPMIRPYYDSRQIKGLVTGLAGGKAYEQSRQMTGLAQKYWNSFSYGLFIAELIIIAGALWSIISIMRDRNKPGIEGEA